MSPSVGSGLTRQRRRLLVRTICEHVFVPELRYTVTEYDPQRPWVMVSRTRGLAVDLDAEDFPAWAARAWPATRYTTEIEPGALRPWQQQ
jgi:hypothetical protein